MDWNFRLQFTYIIFLGLYSYSHYPQTYLLTYLFIILTVVWPMTYLITGVFFFNFSWLAFKMSFFRSFNGFYRNNFLSFSLFHQYVIISLDYLIIIATGLWADATGVWQVNHSNDESRSQWAYKRTGSQLATDICRHMESTKNISHFGKSVKWRVKC